MCVSLWYWCIFSMILFSFNYSRAHVGEYLCIASNGVPPSISKRIVLRVQCKLKNKKILKKTVCHSTVGYHKPWICIKVLGGTNSICLVIKKSQKNLSNKAEITCNAMAASWGSELISINQCKNFCPGIESRHWLNWKNKGPYIYVYYICQVVPE